MTFDTIIKNGTVLDGSSGEGRFIDVGITGGKITALDDLKTARAARVVDAYRRYVTPGFVDAQNHSDSYFTLLEIPHLPSLTAQGITTIAVGHCGTSLAPLPGPAALKSIQKWHSLAGANINWLSFAEYFNVLQNYPLGVNVMSLVGHATLRRGLVGDQIRAATPEEIKIIEKMVRDSFDAGAGGISLGLVYAHEADSTAAELASIASLAGSAHRPLSAHLRSEGAHAPAAVAEALALAESGKASIKISHLKIRGKQNWAHLDETLALLDQAYQRGVDAWFDTYPYSTSWTVLYTYLPKWAYEGGRAAILEHLQNRSTRSKILAYLRDQERDLGRVFIATSQTNPTLVGKTLSQVAANQEITVEEALLNVLTATATQVIVFDHNVSEEGVETLLRHPLSVVATDGAGYDFAYNPGHGLLHPRCFGAMPKFLSMVREKKLMSWSEAVKKISSRPAEKLGLRGRGKIAVGDAADIVVFDPNTVGSKASYENPYVEPDGIDLTLVNGEIAYSSTEGTRKLAGKVIRV